MLVDHFERSSDSAGSRHRVNPARYISETTAWLALRRQEVLRSQGRTRRRLSIGGGPVFTVVTSNKRFFLVSVSSILEKNKSLFV